MIRIMYGADSYSRTLALDRLRDELAVEGADILRLDAATPMDELLAAAQTLPFLAPRRLVIIGGLLARAGAGRRRGRGRRTQGGARARSAPAWTPLVEAAPNLPPSTELVLVDDDIDRDNPLLKALEPYAETRRFHRLRPNDVRGWIAAEARRAEVRIAPEAVRLLAELCGSNLWAAAAEIEKLWLYVEGREATADDVRALTATVREETAFALADAIVAGQADEALRLVARLRADGQPGPYLIAMIARQYRLLILARELAGGGLSRSEIGRRIGLTNEFALGRVAQRAARIEMGRLERAMARILEADLAMKRGQLSEDLALDLLVTELARP